MQKKNIKTIFLFPLLCSGLIFCLSGCSGQIATHQEAVASIKGENVRQKIPDNFAGNAESGKVDDDWLKNFKDPELEKLVNEALAKNPGLKIVEARVDAANSLVRQAEAKLKPTIGLAGSYQERRSDGFDNLGTAGLGVSWEADVWGRIRTGAAAQKEAALASASDFQFARQSLAAATANGWFLAITAKLQNKFAEEIVKLRRKNLEIAEAREKIGQGSGLDTHLARGNVAKAEEAARTAQSAYENSLRSLELLLGRYPSADLATADRLVAVPPPIPAGMPSQMLERRPDLIAAEHNVAATFQLQKEAELLHLPRFRFSLGIGINSLTDAIAGLTAGIFAPLYTGGAIEGRIDTATANQKKAIAEYAQTALRAFKEVEELLAAETHLMKREEYLQIEVNENKKANDLIVKQYEIGKIPFLDVLTIQGKWVESRIARLDIAGKRLVNRVKLHLALGGSFEQEE